ncbi:helix-loop-helix DNA-binding domain-containing protein [Chlamydoabsidia padenii]|nr:helix-loop-helix DNA-binding domain-containing protein [Chlamydoabsidia padenii]
MSQPPSFSPHDSMDVMTNKSTPTSPRMTTCLPPMVLPLPMVPVTHHRTSKHKTTADDREHHRRLSHSAIEKRRRERINDKIDQLKYLIPSCCPTTALPSASMHQPLHKLSVLQAAIDYIQQLHLQLVQQAPMIDSMRSDKDLDMILSHVRQQRQQQQQQQQLTTPTSSP